MRLKINNTSSYKIGVDEIEGLEAAMRAVLAPVLASINSRVYWGPATIESTEYKSRDGFMAYSHNLGGVEISLIVPDCERDSFSFVDFGECDDEECPCRDPEGNGECIASSEGHLDAKVRVWLKLESVDVDTGELSFWLYCGGGNGDAPYFRTKYEHDVFAAEFKCVGVFGLAKAAAPYVAALLDKIK